MQYYPNLPNAIFDCCPGWCGSRALYVDRFKEEVEHEGRWRRVDEDVEWGQNQQWNHGAAKTAWN